MDIWIASVSAKQEALQCGYVSSGDYAFLLLKNTTQRR